ncbi:MAG: HAD family phosphatase [Alphaproteobacteria bacterium]|nr:HAD family phosphatase [Alphaproteobacteria bacterium]
MPEERNVKLLLADVDGTLVTKDKILTARAQHAVHALHERGIQFAITSGRPPKGMAMLIEPLAIKNPIGGFNGGAFVKPDLTIIETRTLPPDVAQQAIALIEQHGLDCWLYVGNGWLLRDPKAPHVAREAWTVKFEPTVVASFGGRLDAVLKIVGVSDDLDRVAAAEKAAQQAFGDRASAARSQPYYLDVTHHDANKGFVIRYLSEHLGIPLAEIATIGDQPNDVLMFRPSGFSIAMGNAPDEVKRQAAAVTDSYEDEGFAKAVEKHLLGD